MCSSCYSIHEYHILLPLQRQQTKVVEAGGMNWSRFPSSATCRRFRKASYCLTTLWMAWRSVVRRRAAVQVAVTCAITRLWWGECRGEATMVTAGAESSLPPSLCFWKSAGWCRCTVWFKIMPPKRWAVCMWIWVHDEKLMIQYNQRIAMIIKSRYVIH